MYCKKCGSILEYGDTICNNCGGLVERAEGETVKQNVKEDVKILQSTKQKNEKEKFKWDVKDFPTDRVKKQEDIEFSWGKNRGETSKDKNEVPGMNLYSGPYVSPFAPYMEADGHQEADAHQDLESLSQDDQAIGLEDAQLSKAKEDEAPGQRPGGEFAGMSLFSKDIPSPINPNIKTNSEVQAPKEGAQVQVLKRQELEAQKAQKQENNIAGMSLFASSVASPMEKRKASNQSDQATQANQSDQSDSLTVPNQPAQANQESGPLKWTDTRPYKPVRKAEVGYDQATQQSQPQAQQPRQAQPVYTGPQYYGTAPQAGGNPADQPKNVEITKKPIDFPFDEEIQVPKLEEKKAKKDKEGSGAGKALLIILIILLAIGLAAFGLSKYMPDSIAGQWINGIFGIENTQTGDQDLIDLDLAVSSQLFNNKNIGEVASSNSLTFDEGQAYSLLGVADSQPVTKADQAICEQLIGRVIKFNSDWVGYLNNGEEEILDSVKASSPMESQVLNYERKGQVQIYFDKLELGEVRQGNGGYFVWAREHTTINDGSIEEKAVAERIYFLEAENDNFVISNFQ